MAVILWNNSVKQLIQNFDLFLCQAQHLLAISVIQLLLNHFFPLLNLICAYQSFTNLFMLLHHSTWNAYFWLLMFKFVSSGKWNIYPVWTHIIVSFFPSWGPSHFFKSRHTLGKFTCFLHLFGTCSILLFKHLAQAYTLRHGSRCLNWRALLLWRLCFSTFGTANFKFL